VALNPRQKLFADLYEGNATEAARRAGYGGSDETLATQGWYLLRNPEVRAAIDARLLEGSVRRIATREERQAFWTEMMLNPLAKDADRLRAAELLGKSQADFIDRVQHDGVMSIAVVDPYAKPKPE